MKPNDPKGAPFFILGGDDNLKILIIIIIYCTIFIKFGTYIPDTITRLFNWVETVISERGPFF